MGMSSVFNVLNQSKTILNTAQDVMSGLKGIGDAFKNVGTVVGDFSGAFTSGVFRGFTFDLALALGTTLNNAAQELQKQSRDANAKDPKAMLQLTAAAEAYRAAATQAQSVISALGDAAKTLSRNG
jgi:hypothetical protein